MKKFKKFFAVILSLAMVLGMSLTSFAAEVPNENNKTNATVSNIEAGAVVTAYRIVKPVYKTNGITGYEATTNDVAAILVNKDGKADPTNVSSDQITQIANLDLTQFNAADKNMVTMTAGAAGEDGLATYSAELYAGYWMVIVSKGATGYAKVYNPMLLGVYYSVSGSDDTLKMEPVDASKPWTLATENAFVKSSEPTFNKYIVENKGDANEELVKGNDAAFTKDPDYGDVIDFRIETAIPSYSDDYEEVVVTIADALDPGLTLDVNSIKVSVGDEDVTNSKVAYVAHDVNASGFVLDFLSDYAKANNNKSVVVEYSATINKDAKVNYDFNKNTATLNYTNNPSDAYDTKEVDDKTYTYTFAIDTEIMGEQSEEWQKLTEEIVKTGESKTIDLGGGSTTTTTRLKGAEFTLTRTDTKKPDGSAYVYKETTDENGYLKFRGLDSGTYTLVETKAPEGYSLNDTPATVEISSVIDPITGLLNEYTIKINNEKTSTYKATYTGEKITNIEYVNGGTQLDAPDENHQTTGASDIFEIKNTKLASLPSTGGIGTTIFTIGGCLIMVVAAGLFFASRRKSAK